METVDYSMLWYITVYYALPDVAMDGGLGGDLVEGALATLDLSRLHVRPESWRLHGFKVLPRSHITHDSSLPEIPFANRNPEYGANFRKPQCGS